MANETTEVVVDATRMEFIAALAQKELAFQAKMKPLITDVSIYAEKGNKSIEFPLMNSFTAEKISGATPASLQNLTYSTEMLNLDQHATVQFLIKHRAELQSRLQVEMENIKRAAAEHARVVDKDILEAMALGAAVANDVTYNPLAIEDNILEAIQKLDEQNAPEENRFLVFRPAQKKILLGVSNFIDASKYGDRTPILTGEIGMAYGVRFVMSNALTTNFVDGTMMMFNSDAAAIGFQLNPIVDEQKAIEFGALSKRIAIDQLYGVKVLQAGKLISKIA